MEKMILEKINLFRNKPTSFEKSAEMYYKTLKKSKKDLLANKLEAFISRFKSSKVVLKNISFCEKLSKSAQDELLNVIKNKGNLIFNNNTKELNDRLVKLDYIAEEVFEISDYGEEENIIFRLAINEFDSDKLIDEVLLGNKFLNVGISVNTYNNQILTNFIFASDNKQINKSDYGENQELKEAFDLFDIYHTGKLDQVTLKEAFIGLGFDKTSHSVYNAILKLNNNNKVIKQGGVDWDTFVSIIKDLAGDFESKEGLKKIFDLFIDDPKQDKISAETLKKVSKEIEDDTTYNEIVKILKRSSENGSEIDFEEFCRIMKDYEEINNHI